MKKITAILMISVVLLALVACDPSWFYFDYDELKESVVQVELIYYDNPDAKQLFEQRDKVKPFDFDKMTIVEVLPEEKLDDFLKDLSEIPIAWSWRHMDSPMGYSIRVIYSNGDFEVLSFWSKGWNGCYSGSFDSDGNVKRFIGDGISEWLFDKYFVETSIC